MDTTRRAIKPTMEDVARRAGVSSATVARTLYRNGYVKPETRQMVEAAVAETGYRPSVVARGLRHRRSFTIGVVVREARLNALHAAMSRVIEVEAMQRGYAVLKLNNNRDVEMERVGVQRFLDHDVEAVIFCSAIDPESVRTILSHGIPAVQVERETAAGGNLVTVDPDAGIGEAIDHLVALGHRTFAFIGGDSGFHIEGPIAEAVEERREQAFLKRLRHHRIDVAPGCMLRGSYYHELDGDLHPGYDMMRSLIQLTPRPTAILFGSDLLAASATQAIHDAGLTVPGDFSLVGYDNSIAEFLTPPLSSIGQPVEELGRAAIEIALDDAGSRRLGAARREMKTHFVRRASTGPAPTRS
jgi:LacI family transcriptional regulator